MRIETLDHVALWVSDRDALADFVTTYVGMHVIERTEKFTLVGSNARRGKLTLFAADGEREPRPLVRVGLRVNDLDAAVAALPETASAQRVNESARFDAPEGLGLALVEAETEIDYDIDHVLFAVPDPTATFASLVELGFENANGRLKAGDSYIDLEVGELLDSSRPLLNHLGLRVSSADDHLSEAEERGIEIADVVDGPNTYAVFVWGPDRIKLEYVEHKPTFSLV